MNLTQWLFGNNTLTNTPAAGASVNYAAGNLGTMIGFLPLIALATAGILIVIVLLLMLADWEHYKKLKGIAGWIFRTFGYFLYGIFTAAVIGIPCGLIYLFGSSAEANPQILIWIGEAFLGYIGLTLVGWVTKKRLWDKIIENFKKDKLAEVKA